jgi:hypothetical protein
MEIIAGRIVSKTTNKSYSVKWDSDLNSSYIGLGINTWLMVCEDVKSSEAAIKCAQTFIDSQIIY